MSLCLCSSKIEKYKKRDRYKTRKLKGKIQILLGMGIIKYLTILVTIPLRPFILFLSKNKRDLIKL